MAYFKLAYIYDLLMEDAPYDEWEEFILDNIKKHHPQAKKVLDLGCGTGEMSNRLASKGFSVTGIDYSEDMLAYAQAETEAQNLSVSYLHQDMRSLEGLALFDVVISICDVMNYLTDETDIKKTLENIAHVLKDDGIFLFDVHSVKHFKENMVNQTFSEIYDDISYIWFCEEGQYENEVIHDLTFFMEKEGENLYERFDEIHYQRTFPIKTYRRLISEVGLEIIGIFTDFSKIENKNPESGNRIFFVCKK